jgi:hypothetical protein
MFCIIHNILPENRISTFQIIKKNVKIVNVRITKYQ